MRRDVDVAIKAPEKHMQGRLCQGKGGVEEAVDGRSIDFGAGYGPQCNPRN